MRWTWLARRLRGWALDVIAWRPPDFVIGADNPQGAYLKRWCVIPRNPLFNIYLHEFLRDDDDRALHDHPWVSVPILLSGLLIEETPSGKRLLRFGRIVFRGARAAHRLEIPAPELKTLTLFITGPRVREWGFHCPSGWVHWKTFTAAGAPGEIGPGCGE